MGGPGIGGDSSLPLSWKTADNTGEVEALGDTPGQLPAAFSADGTELVVEEVNGADSDLGLLTLGTKRTSTALLVTAFAEAGAALSPDGRWLAYSSNESGQHDVSVVTFPDVNAGRWPISTGGGWRPVWNPAGNELFYGDPK